MQNFSNSYSINSLNMLILLNIPKHGGMRNIMTNWPDTDSPRWLRAERFSKNLLKRQNVYFLTIKSKKSHWKTKDLKTL